MPPTVAPPLDVNAIAATVLDRTATLPERERELARRTLHRLRSPNWTLEWHLPWWLGEAFGVPSPITHRAVASNVLGLMAVRLRDDADDGELDDVDPELAGRLAAALLDAAIELYRPMLAPDATFWHELDGWLTAWRAATEGNDGSPPLAARGAPLKAGARAMTLLGNRPAAWPLVERCLDAALTALALYDDASDWERDLEAGRWNAFVAGVGVADQRPANRDANRARVLLALLDDGAATEAYGMVSAEAGRAAVLAAEVGCEPLAEHLRAVATRAVLEGDAIEAHYAAAAARMTRMLFEPSARGGTHP